MEWENTQTKRAVAQLILLLALFFICILRLFVLSSDEKLVTAGDIQSGKRFVLYRPRGNIYDCNMLSLTQQETETKIAVLPTEKGAIALSRLLSGTELQKNLNRLHEGTPVLLPEMTADIYTDTLRIKIPKRYNNAQAATHLIGYINGEGQGVSGIEKAMNDALYSEETVDLVLRTNAIGETLPGIQAEITKGSAVSDLVLTIDNRIQQIAEKAAKQLPAGAVVVSEVGTGKVRAMVSTPSYNPNAVEEVLTAENSPLLNRALTTYSVGSVFKPCVAAAAIESGVSPARLFNCTGSMTIADRQFHCHKLSGHGMLELCGALGQSCNCYFYQLSQKLGTETLLRYMRSFSFGQSRDIGCNIRQPAGTVPTESDIKNPGNLANLSIGQGDLLLTPLAISSLYEAIAGDGVYHNPSILEAVIQNGERQSTATAAATRAMSAETATLLKQYLIQAFQDGTGKEAAPETPGVVAGGKTATAETGWLKNGKAITHGWLCGFVEVGEKCFTIVVFCEEATSGATSCSPVFKQVAEQLAQLF
ncbi:MAG: penicillin-binding protein 2 [Clostridia bacterium]|nr:penicillin-binding protein 2 [Clostridia bacterium]